MGTRGRNHACPDGERRNHRDERPTHRLGPPSRGAQADQEPGETEAQAVAEIQALGRKALYIPADVTDPEACVKAVAAALEAFGKGDILVNNAGITRDDLIMRMPIDDWKKVLEVNLFGAFYMTQGMFQIGDPAWERYFTPLRALLLDHQAGDGSWPFAPDDAHQGRLAGPAYSTAMAVLILSMEKQYLPMYQRQAAMFR